jgi:FK506-binding protein 1
MAFRTLTSLTRITHPSTPLFHTTKSLFHTTARTMGVQKTILVEGNGPSPQKGDTVTMLYTGWLKEAGKKDSKGKQFDTTEKPGRGPFKTPIGVGRVIKGALPLVLSCGGSHEC